MSGGAKPLWIFLWFSRINYNVILFYNIVRIKADFKINTLLVLKSVTKNKIYNRCNLAIRIKKSKKKYKVVFLWSTFFSTKIYFYFYFHNNHIFNMVKKRNYNFFFFNKFKYSY